MSELYSLPNGWEWVEFSKIFDTPTSKPYQIQKTEYLENGLLPIIDQGKEFIIGYTNLIEKKYLNESNCIIFGDHTRQIKYVDFDFVIGADGTKILKEKDKNKYDLKFLYFQFLSKKIESLGYSRHFKLVKEMFFAIPPLEEQKRIVAKLDNLFAKIDKAIALHQKNIDEADIFIASVLNDVFVELEEKYEKIPLFDVADVNRGKSKHRPRNDKKLFGGNYPFIQTGDVRNANKYIDTFSETYSEFGLSQSKLWKKGTICMTIAANIGDVAILNIDSCFPDSVVGIYSENNSNDFLYYFLLTLKQQLESQATTTAQMNINLKILQTIGVPLPPLKTQQKVVSYLDEISNKMEKIKQIQKEKMQSLKELKASILDKAFKGEL
ncbi:restriction endonuclease subunit S [Aliarcobacter cryaerophilus]|uniref:restriction endonuclease subunit S n=1 Tax=Aliarcobacter cryaerophilus TaxID=28198 RepID=UPI003BB08565